MARLEYDFADLTVAKLFPAHGWAINSQGVKILWCPLSRLLVQSDETLQKRDGPALNGFPFAHSLRKLATTLRELHQLVRVSCEHPCMTEDLAALTADLRAMETMPLFVDLAFTYLRRLPDRLVVACRPLLFENWKSVPLDFKDWVTDIDRLAAHKPSCNFAVLRETIVKHSAWFNELRDKSPTTGKIGIRDAFEHRDIHLLVGKQQVSADRPHMTAMIDSRAHDVDIHKDILPRIPESVAGLCQLMTGIYSAIGVGSRYEWGDFLSLVGTDDDIVGYWPQIQA